MHHTTTCRRPRLVRLLAVLAVIALGASACSDGNGVTSDTVEETPTPTGITCDDQVKAGEIPADTRERMAAHDIDRAVGEGDVWFIAPASDTWGALLTPEGTGYRAKVALWVDADGDLPKVTVIPIGNGASGFGTADSNPTSNGLPGPVPTTISVPSPGCWFVTATIGGDLATITLSTPPDAPGTPPPTTSASEG